MNTFQLSELIYDKINLDKAFKSCTTVLGSNVINIEDKDGNKFVLVSDVV